MTVSVDITGTITAQFTQTITNGVTTYALVSISPSGIEVDGDLTVPFSVAALPSGGTWESWLSPFTWSDDGILGLAGAGIQVVSLVGGVLSGDPGAILDILPTINSLETIGPTNRTLPIPQAITLSYGGTTLTADASVDIAYDVTIPDAAWVLMDQANVILNSLTIQAGGVLSAGSGGFTVNAQLDNAGSLDIVSGSGGTITGDFSNSGDMDIGGSFTIFGAFINTGTISVSGELTVKGGGPLTGGGRLLLIGGGVEVSSGDTLSNLDNTISGYGLLFNLPLINQADGVIDANVSGLVLSIDDVGNAVNQGLIEATSGGTLFINSGASIDNTGGTVAALSGGLVQLALGAAITGGTVVAVGGTVDLDEQSALVDVTLTGNATGVFESTASFNAGRGFGSALQNVTIEAGATYAVLSGFTALRDTIDNAGVMTVATNTEFVIDGIVTLAGGGQIEFGSQGGGLYICSPAFVQAASESTDPSTLINVDNTISGQGTFFEVALTNHSDGTIDADITGQTLNLDVGATINQGLIEATSGGTLFINSGASIDNTGGTVAALSGGLVQLALGAAITGGTVVAVGGTVDLDEQSALVDVTLTGNATGVFESTASFNAGRGFGSALQNVTIEAGATYAVLSGFTALRDTIDNSGTLAALSSVFAVDGTVTLAGNGQLELGAQGQGGGIYSAAFVALVGQSSDPSTLINIGNTISGQGLIFNVSLTNQTDGVIDANVSGQALSIGNAINQGLIEATNGGMLFVASLSGTGTVAIKTASVVEVQSTISAGETILFSGSGSTLLLDNPGNASVVMTNFAPTETIDLHGVNPDSVTYTDGQLNFTPLGGGSASLSLVLAPSTTSVEFGADNNGGTDVTALCFLVGTQIATPSGEVPVERLVVGDEVLTSRGTTRSVTWVGIGRALATRGRRGAATPVIVRKGALAANVPHRDLRVTKGHSLLIDDVLIPVEFLINHRSILWDDHAQEVNLFHIELASHDVLLADGAPAESYRDDGNRWLFQNANSGWHLPPQEPCTSVLTGGAVVDAIWRRLLERAGPRRGLPLTDDPDLHLLVDGVRLDAVGPMRDVCVFNLFSIPITVHIISRAAVPQELGLARDPRSLGVALRRIIVRQGTRFKVVEADDARLTEGCHAFEAGNGLRWTDGNAVVPKTLFTGFCGPIELVLHLGGTTQYLASSAVQRAA